MITRISSVLIVVALLNGCAGLATSRGAKNAGGEDVIDASSAPLVENVNGTEPLSDATVGADEELAAKAGNGTEASPKNGENGEAEDSFFDEALELTDAAQSYWAEGDSEKAIEALDQAYASILKVEGENGSKVAQQKEDLRFMISKRILEIYASRHTTVNGLHTPIPMTMNEYVEREIKVFQGIERDFFLESYQRSGRYYPEIVQAFRDAGLPEDLAWLPLIESGFKVRALSRARALGLWQFIPSTGYKFGLKRNDWIDERLDPAKSTQAAIAYLKELHQIFGDWTTVLAAYNSGEGNVLRVIRGQKINYLDNFWDLFLQLPRETSRYVPRYLATLSIIKDPGRYGFTLGEPDRPVPSETVTMEKPVHLGAVANAMGIPMSEIAALNPELRRDATPPTRYSLKVPKGGSDTLLAKLDSLAKYVPPKPEYVFHRVRRGETLSGIALRYRTSVQRIAETNRMSEHTLLRAGKRLKIPVRSTT